MPRGGRKKGLEEKKALRSKEKEDLASVEERLAQDIDPKTITKFSDVPLSKKTLEGLKESGFFTPTGIQKEALVLGLKGRDVLGAAKTGSGKTLAFLLPVIERLYKKHWSKLDGVGAIIISPTRELALQTFQTLTKVGRNHDFSAGLVIGGTTFESEAVLIARTNIIICTPGRLLQHMDETAGFNCDTLEVLVLDEADRILDLGFSKTLNAIIPNLPPTRQTLLFSATQTRDVQQLARLSLNDPVYVNVHAQEQFATPAKLTQAYMEIELPQKVDVLFSFIKTHLDKKTVVFVSSCKQVRFLYETLRRLSPGIPLMALFGKQKQAKRVAIFKDFSKKNEAVLFATDIASRGLDIPAVDWVVQFDCPEDVDTYIHRVGRTARADKGGKALLFLIPSEMKMVKQLEEKKIPIIKTEANTSRLQTITGSLRAFCAEDPPLKYLAQKCFISYVRSVHLQGNKEVFDVNALPTEEFAHSLGLPSAPRIKFVKKSEGKDFRGAKNVYGGHDNPDTSSDEEEEEEEEEEDNEQDGTEAAGEGTEGKKLKPVVAAMRFDKLRKKQNTDVLSAAFNKIRALSEAEGGDDLFEKAAVQRHEDMEVEEDLPTITSKKKVKKQAKPTLVKLKKMDASRAKHIEFDDQGNASVVGPKLAGVDVDAEKEGKERIEELVREGVKERKRAAADLKVQDVIDKEVDKARIRARKLEKKMKQRALRLPDGFEDAPGGVVWAGPDGEDGAEDGGEAYSDGGEDDGARGGFSAEEEEDDEPAPRKSSKKGKASRKTKYLEDEEGELEDEAPSTKKSKKGKSTRSLEDDESLALRLLGAQ